MTDEAQKLIDQAKATKAGALTDEQVAWRAYINARNAAIQAAPLKAMQFGSKKKGE